MSSRSENLKVYILFFAIFGSYMSYLNFKFPYLGYVLTTISLAFYFLFFSRYRPSIRILYLSAFYLFLIIFSLLGADSFFISGLIQQLIYPLSFILILFLARNFPQKSSKLAELLLVIVLFNFFCAFLNSLFGPVNLPVLGLLRHGREIFFIDLPSSAGLFWGVNYYAISNLVLSLFISYLYARDRQPLKFKIKIMLTISYFSVFWGSSRSITFILLVCVGLIVCFNHFNHKKVIFYSFISFVLLSFSTVTIYNYISNDPYFNETFRVYKGLNNRGDIWDASFASIYKNPILGSGSITSFEQDIVSNGSPTTAVQNMYLLSILKNGVFGFVILFTFLVISFYGFYKSSQPSIDKYLLLIVFAISLDGFFRSYSLGGLGAASFIFSLSIALLVNKDSLTNSK